MVEEEGGQYIEMDLGLGVLEEKGGRSESEESGGSESGGSESGEGSDANEEWDVLGRLMGFGKRGRRRERPGIEVLEAVD